MEDIFGNRDYSYAIEDITTDEIVPIKIREYIARIRKFIVQLPGIGNLSRA